MEELEKAKLLAVAQKIAKSEVAEVRTELLEEINRIQSITPTSGIPGRGIIDVALIEEELVLQFNDGSFANLGRIIGEQGIQGPRGEQGLQGEQGITGEQGIQGEHGIPGIQGEQGIQGDKGDRGDQGPRGEKGEKGDTGDRGEQGIPGERGERGEQGPAAIDGTAGRDGAKGATGARGDQGLPGRDGKDGKSGKDGLAGPKGDKGDAGEKGDKGNPGSDAEVSKLEKKLSEFSEQVDKRLSKVAFNVAAKGGPAGSGEVLLHRLDDVDYASVKTPSNGQSLVWNSSISKWKASSDVSVGTLTISGAIVPSGNTPISIGSPSSPFGSLYLSSNTIYIGNAAISSNGPRLIIPNQTYFANGVQVGSGSGTTITANGTVNLAPYLQVSNANAKFATKAYSAANTYVKAVLANTNLYIATKVPWSSLTSTNTAVRTLIDDRLQVANASVKFTTKAYAAANSYVKTLLANTNSYIATKPQFYYSTTMYNYTAYGLGWMNVAPNQDPATLGFRTDVPAPPFGSIWILAVNDGLVDAAPITIYSPNTRTTPMLWMSIDGSGPFSDLNPNGQAYWFNITPPPSGA